MGGEGGGVEDGRCLQHSLQMYQVAPTSRSVFLGTRSLGTRLDVVTYLVPYKDKNNCFAP